MATITISDAQTSEQSTTSLNVTSEATAYVAHAARRDAPLFVPHDQAYYWTMAWQRDEAEALREIAEGQARRFSSGAAAAAWLLADDGEDGEDGEDQDGDDQP